MAANFMGLQPTTFNGLVLLLLLVILGIVSFHYYGFVSTKNGLRFGTGFDVSLLPQYSAQQQQQQQLQHPQLPAHQQ